MFSDLKGKTLSDIIINEDKTEIEFNSVDGKKWRMFHKQDCCESVYVEDICGDINDIIGSPIIEAVESSNENKKGTYDTETWTFYKIDTAKGGVTIRWYGTSNGYYSEEVTFKEIKS